MEKKRFEQIDFLRAVSIIGMIAIHVAAFNLSNSTAFFAWNYLQFVVVAFVFCSGYVSLNFSNTEFLQTSQIITWLKKRLTRLLLPFYIYFVTHFSLWYFFPYLFSGYGLQRSPSFIFNSLFLTGGLDLNWLPLLFLELTLLLVVLNFLKRITSFYLGYLLFTLTVSLIFTFFDSFSQFYRFTMWIPWSLVLLTGLKISALENQSKFKERKYIIFGSLFFSVFIILFVLFGLTSRSLIFRAHKYPPDLYYLTYALGLTMFIIVFAKLKFFSQLFLKRLSLYISTNSYALFFIHIIVLDFFFNNLKKFYFFSNWLVQFLTILSLSLLVKLLIDKGVIKYQSLKSAQPSKQNITQKDGFWSS